MGFHSRSVFANASCGCQFGIRKCIVVKSLGNLLLGLARPDKAFTKPHSLNSLVLDRLTVNGYNAVDSHVSLVVTLGVCAFYHYRYIGLELALQNLLNNNTSHPITQWSANTMRKSR